MNDVMWRDDMVYPASAYRAALAEIDRLRELACTCPTNTRQQLQDALGTPRSPGLAPVDPGPQKGAQGHPHHVEVTGFTPDQITVDEWMRWAGGQRYADEEGEQ